MPTARLVAGVLVAASLAVSAEARAGCIDPASCFCGYFGDVVETFSGTIVPGPAGADSIQVRIDSDNPTGSESWLEVGDVVSMSVTGEEGKVSDGAHLVGMSVRTCGTGLMPCGDLLPEPVGVIRVAQIAAAGDSFACGGTKVSASAGAIAAAMASSSCTSEMGHFFLDSGVETGCVRSGDCSMQTGPASSGGWIAVLGIAALIGRRRLRR